MLNKEIFDPSVLIKDVVRRLYAYEPTEIRNIITEDHTLIGMLSIVTILIERSPTALEPNELEELAIMLLERCLFSLNFEPIDQHITQNVHLGPIERKNINKCHSKESIQASYNMLLTICKTNRAPLLTDKILEKYWLR